MDLQLNGKRVIVTGGSRGIGKIIAKTLAVEGCDVVIVSRGREMLEAAARELARHEGGRIFPVIADVAETASVINMVATAISTLGGIDILINNAAVTTSGGDTIASTDEQILLEDLNIKLLGYMRTARAVGPVMAAAGWGRIINIGGAATRMTGHYPTSIRNAAISAFVGNLADELGPKGVTVNVIHPGGTVTDEWPSEEVASSKLNNIGRAPRAEEVAYIAAMLASPLGAAINGESILVSGGRRGAISY